MTKPVILHACVHNGGRSFAAKVPTEHHANGTVDVHSAGSDPGSSLNPAVVQILHEMGLNTDGETPKLLTYDGVQAAFVITMGCGETCPIFRQDLRRLDPRRPQRPRHRDDPPNRRRGRRPSAGPPGPAHLQLRDVTSLSRDRTSKYATEIGNMHRPALLRRRSLQGQHRSRVPSHPAALIRKCLPVHWTAAADLAN